MRQNMLRTMPTRRILRTFNSSEQLEQKPGQPWHNQEGQGFLVSWKSMGPPLLPDYLKETPMKRSSILDATKPPATRFWGWDLTSCKASIRMSGLPLWSPSKDARLASSPGNMVATFQVTTLCKKQVQEIPFLSLHIVLSTYFWGKNIQHLALRGFEFWNFDNVLDSTRSQQFDLNFEIKLSSSLPWQESKKNLELILHSRCVLRPATCILKLSIAILKIWSYLKR